MRCLPSKSSGIRHSPHSTLVPWIVGSLPYMPRPPLALSLRVPSSLDRTPPATWDACTHLARPAPPALPWTWQVAPGLTCLVHNYTVHGAIHLMGFHVCGHSSIHSFPTAHLSTAVLSLSTSWDFFILACWAASARAAVCDTWFTLGSIPHHTMAPRTCRRGTGHSHMGPGGIGRRQWLPHPHLPTTPPLATNTFLPATLRKA